jgi:hypothetical protein
MLSVVTSCLGVYLPRMATKEPKLKPKTRPKQILGSLSLALIWYIVELGYETTQLPSGGEGVFKIYWLYRLKNYKIPGSLPSPGKTP